MSTTRMEVEAALLNSAGDPREEIAESLLGVVVFARSEVDATDEQLLACFQAQLVKA